MAKVPIQKNKECLNLEGLVEYERFYITQVALGNTKEEYLAFEELAEGLRETYCGSMCFSRYHCALAEKYLQ